MRVTRLLLQPQLQGELQLAAVPTHTPIQCLPRRFGMMPAQMKALFDATGGLWVKGSLVGKPAGVFVSVGTQVRHRTWPDRVPVHTNQGMPMARKEGTCIIDACGGFQISSRYVTNRVNLVMHHRCCHVLGLPVGLARELQEALLSAVLCEEAAYEKSASMCSSWRWSDGSLCSAVQGGGIETTALTSVTQFAHHGMIFVPCGRGHASRLANSAFYYCHCPRFFGLAHCVQSAL